MHFNQDDINTGERLRGIRESMKMNREEFLSACGECEVG